MDAQVLHMWASMEGKLHQEWGVVHVEPNPAEHPKRLAARPCKRAGQLPCKRAAQLPCKRVSQLRSQQKQSKKG